MKFPVHEGPHGSCLAESNAILNYLAHATPFLPNHAWAPTQLLQWQCFDQYGHERCIAVARFIARDAGMSAERCFAYQAKQEGRRRALQVMEDRVSTNSVLAGDDVTVANLALYAYTHVAHEGASSSATFQRSQPDWTGTLRRKRRCPDGIIALPRLVGFPGRFIFPDWSS